MKPNLPRTKQGFTLIEMVVIILLLAVLTSIIVPSYSRYWHHTRFMGAVNDIAELIADARERAITKDTQTTLSYLGGMQTFKLEVTPPTPSTDMPTAMNTPESLAEQEKSGTGIRGYQLREDTVVQEFSVGGQNSPSVLSAKQEQSLHFREDGTNEGARVVLINDKGYGAIIRVLPATGQVVVDEM